ncbi:putative Glutamate-ammonia-ligase adenylyltransferase [Actinacidiphila bryophytorum]|uniref:Glutamate-ammonia-ligase adenylyltransferase n=1 Tax=Actinacidiphila bryophytorum TaxID=1436133 RepID=A0A9W4H0E6_9ACTN|nr:putative Glutamate-ammonia-ligase adenylyltransferase [Actinacidiphila bryophytorum]
MARPAHRRVDTTLRRGVRRGAERRGTGAAPAHRPGGDVLPAEPAAVAPGRGGPHGRARPQAGQHGRQRRGRGRCRGLRRCGHGVRHRRVLGPDRLPQARCRAERTAGAGAARSRGPGRRRVRVLRRRGLCAPPRRARAERTAAGRRQLGGQDGQRLRRGPVGAGPRHRLRTADQRRRPARRAAAARLRRGADQAAARRQRRARAAGTAAARPGAGRCAAHRGRLRLSPAERTGRLAAPAAGSGRRRRPLAERRRGHRGPGDGQGGTPGPGHAPAGRRKRAARPAGRHTSAAREQRPALRRHHAGRTRRRQPAARPLRRYARRRYASPAAVRRRGHPASAAVRGPGHTPAAPGQQRPALRRHHARGTRHPAALRGRTRRRHAPAAARAICGPGHASPTALRGPGHPASAAGQQRSALRRHHAGRTRGHRSRAGRHPAASAAGAVRGCPRRGHTSAAALRRRGRPRRTAAARARLRLPAAAGRCADGGTRLHGGAALPRPGRQRAADHPALGARHPAPGVADPARAAVRRGAPGAGARTAHRAGVLRPARRLLHPDDQGDLAAGADQPHRALRAGPREPPPGRTAPAHPPGRAAPGGGRPRPPAAAAGADARPAHRAAGAAGRARRDRAGAGGRLRAARGLPVRPAGRLAAGGARHRGADPDVGRAAGGLRAVLLGAGPARPAGADARRAGRLPRCAAGRGRGLVPGDGQRLRAPAVRAVRHRAHRGAAAGGGPRRFAARGTAVRELQPAGVRPQPGAARPDVAAADRAHARAGGPLDGGLPGAAGRAGPGGHRVAGQLVVGADRADVGRAAVAAAVAAPEGRASGCTP